VRTDKRRYGGESIDWIPAADPSLGIRSLHWKRICFNPRPHVRVEVVLVELASIIGYHNLHTFERSYNFFKERAHDLTLSF